jgi:hypothetical protein
VRGSAARRRAVEAARTGRARRMPDRQAAGAQQMMEQQLAAGGTADGRGGLSILDASMPHASFYSCLAACCCLLRPASTASTAAAKARAFKHAQHTARQHSVPKARKQNLSRKFPTLIILR